MTDSQNKNDGGRWKRLACPHCEGTGTSRNPKHFFYGVSLIASGILVFFQWPPIPSLVGMIEAFARASGLPGWAGTTSIWVLASIPAILGIGFIYSWLSKDTCPACNGSCRAPAVV